MTGEAHEPPAPLLTFGRAGAAGRHPGQRDAVLDEVKELPIRQLLRCRKTHVGRLRIEALTDVGLSAPLVSMTDGAVIRVVLEAVADGFRAPRNRILAISRGRRDREPAREPGDTLLQAPGLGTRAKPATADIEKHRSKGNYQDQ